MEHEWAMILGIVVLIIIGVLTYYGWHDDDSDADSESESDAESESEEEEIVESFADMILTEDIISDPSKYRMTNTVIYFTNDMKECDASGTLSPKYIGNMRHPLFEINYSWNVGWYNALYAAVQRLYRKTRKPLVLLVMSDLERVLRNYQGFADGKFCKIHIPRWKFFNRTDEHIKLGNLHINKARGDPIYWATLGRKDVLRGEIDNHGLHVPKDPDGDYFHIWKDGVRYARGTLPNFKPSTVKRLYCAERGLLSDVRIGSALQFDPYTKKVVFTRNMKKAKPQTHEVLFFLSWLAEMETNTDKYNNVVTTSRTVALPVSRYVKDPCGTWREVRTNVMMRVRFEQQKNLKQVLRDESTRFIQGDTNSLMNSQSILVGRIAEGGAEAAGLVTERVALTKRLTEVNTQIGYYRKIIGRYESEMKTRKMVKSVQRFIKRAAKKIGGIFKRGKRGSKAKRRTTTSSFSSVFNRNTLNSVAALVAPRNTIGGSATRMSSLSGFGSMPRIERFVDYDSDTEDFDSDGYESFDDDDNIEGFKGRRKFPKISKPKMPKISKPKMPKISKPKKISFKKIGKAFSKGGPIAKAGKKTIKRISRSKLVKTLQKKVFKPAVSTIVPRANKKKINQLNLKIVNARNELKKLEILRVAITTALQQNILQNFNLNAKLNRYNSFRGIVTKLHWDVLMKMKQYVVEELEAGRLRVEGAPNRGDLPQEHLKHISDDGKIYIKF